MARYPHDAAAYTQGLVARGDTLFESTGLLGHSELRRVDLRTGRIVSAVPLPADRFGEGLALLRGRLYQLTWKAQVGYVYEATTLARTDSFSYAGEGWGLTTDGAVLIMSDGSDSLRLLSPATYRVESVVHVRYQGAPLKQLNELEYDGGAVLANVYQSNWIARIDLRTGTVAALLDCDDLYPAPTGRERQPAAHRQELAGDVRGATAVSSRGPDDDPAQSIISPRRFTRPATLRPAPGAKPDRPE